MHQSVALNLFAFGASTGASILAFLAWRRAKAADAIAADPNETEGRRGIARRLVAPLASRMRPSKQTELDELTTALMHAGRRSRDSVDRFLEERVLFILGGLMFGILNAYLLGGLAGMLLADIALLGGIMGPKKLIQWRAVERRDAIAQGLPSAVDLMTTCIEAGLSLEQAVARVARDLELASPVLAEELQITASEFSAGVSLPDALRRLSRRVGLDDLSALCGVIAQAHGLGAPIGTTLREYADSSRRHRMSVLEERAGKVAAQLTVPLAVCFLPAAMLVILGPAAVQLVRALQ